MTVVTGDGSLYPMIMTFFWVWEWCVEEILFFQLLTCFSHWDWEVWFHGILYKYLITKSLNDHCGIKAKALRSRSSPCSSQLGSWVKVEFTWPLALCIPPQPNRPIGMNAELPLQGVILHHATRWLVNGGWFTLLSGRLMAGEQFHLWDDETAYRGFLSWNRNMVF